MRFLGRKWGFHAPKSKGKYRLGSSIVTAEIGFWAKAGETAVVGFAQPMRGRCMVSRVVVQKVRETKTALEMIAWSMKRDDKVSQGGGIPDVHSPAIMAAIVIGIVFLFADNIAGRQAGRAAGEGLIGFNPRTIIKHQQL